MMETFAPTLSSDKEISSSKPSELTVKGSSKRTNILPSRQKNHLKKLNKKAGRKLQDKSDVLPTTFGVGIF